MTINQGTTHKSLTTVLSGDRTFTGLLVFAFLLFGLIGIINHEMWLDELQAWVIARDSSSFLELLKNLRYEGHPALWHMGLHLISRLTYDPTYMQFFHLLIATCSVYVFARFSPFTKLQKVVFCFGYLFFYEYTIISRNYALGILFIFIFCTFFTKHNKNYLLLSCVLLLLANTNAFSFIIAVILAMALILDWVFCQDITTSTNFNKRNLIVSCIIFFFGIAIAAYQMMPPLDAPAVQAWTPTSNTKERQFVESILNIGKSYFAIPNFFTYQFWNTSIFTSGEAAINLGIIISFALLIFALILFIRKPVVFFLYLSGNFSILLFMHFMYFGNMRHWGHLYILFITCLWISSYYHESEFLINSKVRFFSPFLRVIKSLNKFCYRYKNIVVMTILYAQLATGIFAFTIDLHNPFSESKEVAGFIKNQKIENTLIVGDIEQVNYIGPPLAAYLGKKVHYLGSRKYQLGSFIVWDHSRESKTKQEIYKFFEKISELITLENKEILLVLNHKLDNCIPEKKYQILERVQLKFDNYCLKSQNLHFSKLSEFNKNIIPDENPGFYLYQVKYKENNEDQLVVVQ